MFNSKGHMHVYNWDVHHLTTLTNDYMLVLQMSMHGHKNGHGNPSSLYHNFIYTTNSGSSQLDQGTTSPQSWSRGAYSDVLLQFPNKDKSTSYHVTQIFHLFETKLALVELQGDKLAWSSCFRPVRNFTIEKSGIAVIVTITMYVTIVA